MWSNRLNMGSGAEKEGSMPERVDHGEVEIVESMRGIRSRRTDAEHVRMRLGLAWALGLASRVVEGVGRVS